MASAAVGAKMGHGSLWQRSCIAVLSGTMRAFDEPVEDPPSAEARETAEFVLAELRPLLAVRLDPATGTRGPEAGPCGASLGPWWSIGVLEAVDRGGCGGSSLQAYVGLVTIGVALGPRHLERAREVMRAVCVDLGCEIVEFHGHREHVQLLVSYPPDLALSRLIDRLSEVSSRRLRVEFPDLLRARHLRPRLWSPSYLAGSAGPTSLPSRQPGR